MEDNQDEGSREIFLLRHGETDWNLKGRIQGHADIPLNNNGIELARTVVGKLNGVKIQKIISSDLTRAAETAELSIACSTYKPHLIQD
ncbi:Phosphoglycerate mutase domain protein [mine drainage metagenome]|uniref:Phosphoglycerate mutase domain protein n=1 Tax=mine drainage metagenome TaxID=410659 RepID=T1BRG1_9ZZZZ